MTVSTQGYCLIFHFISHLCETKPTSSFWGLLVCAFHRFKFWRRTAKCCKKLSGEWNFHLKLIGWVGVRQILRITALSGWKKGREVHRWKLMNLLLGLSLQKSHQNHHLHLVECWLSWLGWWSVKFEEVVRWNLQPVCCYLQSQWVFNIFVQFRFLIW